LNNITRSGTSEDRFKAQIRGIENVLERIDSGEETNYDLERVKENLIHKFMDLPDQSREKHKILYFRLMSDIREYRELIQQGLITSSAD